MIFSKTVRLFFLNLSITAALVMAFAAEPANATVIINVTEVGGDVTFSATGSLNITGATALFGSANYGRGIIPGGSSWYVAPGPGGATDQYGLTSFDGPFGTSLSFFGPPSSSSGDNFYIFGDSGSTEMVGVPDGYISGNAITSGMVFSGATIASLTMVPGTYNYTIPNDTITLNIGEVGQAAVPEPSTIVLLGLGGIGLVGYALRKKYRRA